MILDVWNFVYNPVIDISVFEQCVDFWVFF